MFIFIVNFTHQKCPYGIVHTERWSRISCCYRIFSGNWMHPDLCLRRPAQDLDYLQHIAQQCGASASTGSQCSSTLPCP
uniref:NADH dehydrogenase n=1 Tax=Solanum tuberosum TaxID=4113 RepID=M1CEF8_SOLTU